jgi:hypothetical protein
MVLRADIFTNKDKTVRAKVLLHTVINGTDVEPGDEVVVPVHVFRDLKHTGKLEALPGEEEEAEPSLPTAKTVLGDDAVKIVTATIIQEIGDHFPPKEQTEAFEAETAKVNAMAVKIVAALNGPQVKRGGKKTGDELKGDKTGTRKDLREQS